VKKIGDPTGNRAPVPAREADVLSDF